MVNTSVYWATLKQWAMERNFNKQTSLSSSLSTTPSSYYTVVNCGDIPFLEQILYLNFRPSMEGGQWFFLILLFPQNNQPKTIRRPNGHILGLSYLLPYMANKLEDQRDKNTNLQG